MPRKSLDSAIEHRITFGNYERALVTEIKTDIEKGVQIAAISAIAVPATLGIGLVGGMGLLGYGLYQGLSSFGFGNITKEIKDELRDAKDGAWCWWTNKNRKFWGLEPVDCTGKDPDIPPSRREKERTKAEQLEYERYREERRQRSEAREEKQRLAQGLTVAEWAEKKQEYIDEETVFEHTSRPNSQTDDEKAARAARAAAAAAEREAQRQQDQRDHDAYTEERRRRKQEEKDAAAANQEDDDGDPGGSQYGGGSSAGGNDTSNTGDRDESGNAPSRQDDRDDDRGSRGSSRT